MTRASRPVGCPIVRRRGVRASEDGGPDRGSIVAAVRDDDELAAEVSTVDDLEPLGAGSPRCSRSPTSRAARVGHYGFGDGAAPAPSGRGDGVVTTAPVTGLRPALGDRHGHRDRPVAQRSASSRSSSSPAILGTTYLGNTFQSSNYVSNVLFELLAAGALSAVLVPTFVELLDRGDDAAGRAARGALLGLALVVLGVVDVVGVIAAPWIAGPDDRCRRPEDRARAAGARRRSCCGSSSRRSCCTRSARSRSRSSTPSASSPSPALAPIGHTVVIVTGLVVVPGARRAGPRPRPHDRESNCPRPQRHARCRGAVAVVGIGLRGARGFRLRPRFGRRDPRPSAG